MNRYAIRGYRKPTITDPIWELYSDDRILLLPHEILQEILAFHKPVKKWWEFWI